MADLGIDSEDYIYIYIGIHILHSTRAAADLGVDSEGAAEEGLAGGGVAAGGVEHVAEVGEDRQVEGVQR